MIKNNIPKINSIHYGGKWICFGLLFTAVIPGIIWLLFHIFLWWLCAIGVVTLVAFLIVFLIEMWKNNSRIPYYERTLKEKIPDSKGLSILKGLKISPFFVYLAKC